MLRVTIPFADYQIGDLIDDSTAEAEILGSHAAAFVVRAAKPEPVSPPKISSTDKA